MVVDGAAGARVPAADGCSSVLAAGGAAALEHTAGPTAEHTSAPASAAASLRGTGPGLAVHEGAAAVHADNYYGDFGDGHADASGMAMGAGSTGAADLGGMEEVAGAAAGAADGFLDLSDVDLEEQRRIMHDIRVQGLLRLGAGGGAGGGAAGARAPAGDRPQGGGRAGRGRGGGRARGGGVPQRGTGTGGRQLNIADLLGRG